MKKIILILLLPLFVFCQYGNDLSATWNNSTSGDYPFSTFTTSGDSITSAINTVGTTGRCANGNVSITNGSTYRSYFTFDFNAGAATNYVSFRDTYAGGAIERSGNYTGELNEEGFNTFELTATATDASAHLQLTGNATANFALYDFDIRLRINTLYTDLAQADDTDNDTTKTLTEAFVTRGSHSGGTFITVAGTYAESITMDSSFTKWEASGGNVYVTQVNFNSVICTVDNCIYTNISTILNAENVTVDYSTCAASEQKGFHGWRGKFEGFKE